MNCRSVGTEKEKKVCLYLEKNEVKIIARNFRCRQGEIDIIGYHKGYLVFFEVKYRTNSKMGLPEEAVGINKQRKICSVADFYRRFYKISQQRGIRYDVVALDENNIRWYENAFEHRY